MFPSRFLLGLDRRAEEDDKRDDSVSVITNNRGPDDGRVETWGRIG